MKERINILCTTDKNFVPYCGIMLTSLFENNKDLIICVYIFVDESVGSKERESLSMLEDEYKQEIIILYISSQRFAQYPVYNKQWTNSIYYRLLASELLPKNINKIIYLDCDTIVTGSLKSFWKINISNYALGCVPDVWAYKPEVYERLSLHNDGNYFNSGSMLINLAYWREYKLADEYLKYISSNFDKLWFNDQDTLNAVLYKRKLILPVTFNYQIVFLQRDVIQKIDNSVYQQVIEVDKPLIIHYAAPVKPWMILYYKMPYHKEWLYYKNISYWKDIKKSLPKTKVLNWLIKRYIFWPMNIMHYTEYILR